MQFPFGFATPRLLCHLLTDVGQVMIQGSWVSSESEGASGDLAGELGCHGYVKRIPVGHQLVLCREGQSNPSYCAAVIHPAGVPHGARVTILKHHSVDACAGVALDLIRYKVGVRSSLGNDPLGSCGSSPQVWVNGAHSRLVEWDPIQVIDDNALSQGFLTSPSGVG